MEPGAVAAAIDIFLRLAAMGAFQAFITAVVWLPFVLVVLYLAKKR